MGSQCSASVLQLLCVYLRKGEKGKESLKRAGARGLSLRCPSGCGRHWEQGSGRWQLPSTGQDTRPWFESCYILERLSLCWLQVPKLCTSLQSHTGLIMSSGKPNLFTEGAGLCHRTTVRSEPTAGGHCPQDWPPVPGGHSHPGPWGLETRAGPAIRPFRQQHWAPCLWVGRRVSCQLRSIICSSL